MNERKPIFYDEDRLRWRRTRRALEIDRGLVHPRSNRFLRHRHRTRGPAGHAFAREAIPACTPCLRRRNRNLRRPSGADAVKSRLWASNRPDSRRDAVTGGRSSSGRLRSAARAFYVNWDPSSLASLQQHYRDIDLLIPEQLHSITANGRLDVDDDPKLTAWMQSQGIKIPTMPLLNNSDGTIWHVPEMAAMLHNSAGAAAPGAAASSTHIVRSRQVGLALDFEQVPDKSQHDFVELRQRTGAPGFTART